MTRLLLVRHGMADPVGVWLAGRTPGIALNAVGRVQAQLLSDSFARVPLEAIFASPLERAYETAAAIAQRHPALTVQRRDALTDLDFGDWTGRSLDELADNEAWRAFNVDRDGARAARGESLPEVQQRVVTELSDISRRHPDGTVVVVTHAEPIRCAVAWARGATLCDVMHVEVAPGSVSVLEMDGASATVCGVNLRPEAVAA